MRTNKHTERPDKFIRHIDLFSGIGGFALAADRVFGKNTDHTFCEIDPFCQRIIKKHWPQSKIHGDIKTLTKNDIAPYAGSEESGGISHQSRQTCSPNWGSSEESGVDLLTGGFPCQPFSQAGPRRGTKDDRHLWPEMLRVIREFHPRWIIGENVSGLATWSEGLVLEQIQIDLESAGYEVQAFIIPAVGVNAPHRRDRVWIVAHACGSEYRGWRGQIGKEDSISEINRETICTGGISRTSEDATDTGRKRRSKRPGKNMGSESKKSEWTNSSNSSWDTEWLKVATRLCTMDDGLPGGLARPKGWRNAALKGAGNAIVPQVAAEIMQVIKQIEFEM